MSSAGYIEFEMALRYPIKESELPLNTWIWNSEDRLGLEKYIWESLTNKAREYQGGEEKCSDRTFKNSFPMIME